jgi:hypothetical protein
MKGDLGVFNIAKHSFLRNISLVDLLPDLQPGRKERHGPCPFCGGTDRFIVFVDSDRAWCRQCNWKGDSIQLLIDRDGLSFREAQRALGLDTYTAPAAKRQATIHSLALASAKRAYSEWQKCTLDTLVNEYRNLCTECDVAEIGYRAIHRAQHLYTESERSFWTHRLATLYDRIVVLEHDLNVLTYHLNEPARFEWWQEEGVHHA